MFQHKKISRLDDFFLDRSSRQGQEVYFYRINDYTEETAAFIQKYYEAARRNGAVIEGRIPNPDEKNLSYYNEIMGMDFQMNLEFILSGFKKWIPRMNSFQRENAAEAVYDTLDSLRKNGKNENMLKNAYIKFMCWLYYRFERAVSSSVGNEVSKILYEGKISSYELMLLSILSHAGCDVVLLQYHGDQDYLKLDPPSALSDALVQQDGKAFPENFSLSWIREKLQSAADSERLYGRKPEIQNCTNAWINSCTNAGISSEIKRNGLEAVKTSPANRGSDSKLFYNCFCRINGVEDKLTYVNELYQFQLELKNSHRQAVIVNGSIQQPSMEEIAAVPRKNYTRQDQMLTDLSSNIQYTANIELQRLMVKAFIDVMTQEAGQPGMNLNKLTSRAVYLICWLKRYQPQLFSNWKMPDISCFIYMGGCKNKREALFVRFLARLPVDVLILNPGMEAKCCLEDPLLYEINYSDTLAVSRFPQAGQDVQIGTAAYHAERELDTLLYQDSGMYRSQQYAEANVITLRTMYEEIKILWKEELKFRPEFSTINNVVNIPVIFAKVSGVKDGNTAKYWNEIKGLIVEDTYVIKDVPFLESGTAGHPNPMKAYAAEFYKNGRVQKAKIKNHPKYPYSFIREEMQDHMLDKLQLLIDQKLVKGTFENGTEYTITATALNLPKEIVRLIQKFDFTRKNPKLIYINTGERIISLEDAILAAYLHLIGFDVLFFVPTGYQNIEQHFNQRIVEEHQAGEYQYDLRVPSLAHGSSAQRSRWRDKIFKRGT